MKFKNIFKNTSNMAAENTDIDQKLEDVTIENNATAEEVVVEELTVEEQLTGLSARKDKF
jgi:molecular chaperone GrpE